MRSVFQATGLATGLARSHFKSSSRASADQGLTLIELLVVILIMGILAAIGLPSLMGLRDKAYYAEARSNLDAMRDMLMLYSAENGRFPADTNQDTRPAGVPDKWYVAADMPYESSTDYEHWGIGSDECVVALTWFGRNQQRDSQVHVAVAEPGSFTEVEDDLILTISRYACPGQGRGGLR